MKKGNNTVPGKCRVHQTSKPTLTDLIDVLQLFAPSSGQFFFEILVVALCCICGTN